MCSFPICHSGAARGSDLMREVGDLWPLEALSEDELRERIAAARKAIPADDTMDEVAVA